MLLPCLVACGAKPPLISDAGSYAQLVWMPVTETIDPQVLLAEVRARFGQVDSLRADITNWSTSGEKSATMKVRAYFRKPEQYCMTLLENPDPLLNGSKVLYTGGDRCEVKTFFLGFPLKVNLSIGNPRLCTLHGETLPDLGLKRMMGILLDPAAQIRVLGQAQLDTAPLMILEVKSALLKNAAKEVYFVDTRDAFPRIREIYEGDTPVVRCEFEEVLVNPVLPENAFSLD